jgi:uncharacterized protein with PQ loop repeat
MGINEINSYINEQNSFPDFLLRNLSIPSNEDKSFFSKLTEFVMDVAMIIAPLLTYLFQINKFYKTKSSKGFSKFICLLLFLGNILRIFFWFGTRFKKTLLYQSIGIVIFQIILIHLCIKYQDIPIISKINNNNQQSTNSDKPLIHYLINWRKTLNIKYIWKWTKEIEYYKFMFLIVFCLSLLGIFLGKIKLYYHLLGVFAAFFESLTCVPQVYSNCITKNTRNISFQMIFFWFLGDSFRLYYNIRFKAPIQMILGIATQVCLDITVCVQICIYNKRSMGNANIVNVISKNKINDINNLMKKIDELNVIKNNKKTGLAIY